MSNYIIDDSFKNILQELITKENIEYISKYYTAYLPVDIPYKNTDKIDTSANPKKNYE